jgi:cyanophycin synthetase
MALNRSQSRDAQTQNRLILKKAEEMGITGKPLIEGCEDFLELTYKGKSIIINRTRSHRMPLMAGLLAKNKEASNLLLQRKGLPIPDYIVLSEPGEEAVRFLEAYRLVTVKPLDTSRSVGVTLRIRGEDELAEAIRTARRFSKQVMVQKYVEGTDYRVLVIDGKAVGALEYRPAAVEGDGESTVEQLIARLNDSQMRRNGAGEAGSFQPIDIRSGSLLRHLEESGRSLEEILKKGERAELYASGNMLAEDISEIALDRSGDLHPESAQMAVDAAGALQLDVAGVDIRCRDIRLPLTEENGGILEVNALPDMVDQHLLYEGASTDVFELYLRYLFEE